MRFIDRHLWMIVVAIGLSLAWVGGCTTSSRSGSEPCGCQHHVHYHLHCCCDCEQGCGCDCEDCCCPRSGACSAHEPGDNCPHNAIE